MKLWRAYKQAQEEVKKDQIISELRLMLRDAQADNRDLQLQVHYLQNQIPVRVA